MHKSSSSRREFLIGLAEAEHSASGGTVPAMYWPLSRKLFRPRVSRQRIVAVA